MAWIDSADTYTMSVGAEWARIVSGRAVVVVGRLSILFFVDGGPSAVGAAVVEEEGGSDGGTVANISTIWARGYGAHQEDHEILISLYQADIKCPLNLDQRVQLMKDLHSHYNT